MSDEQDFDEIAKEMQQEREQEIDKICAEQKALIRRLNADAVKPDEMPQRQWEDLTAKTLAESDRKIDEAFHRLKLLTRCLCGQVPAGWCPEHPSGRVQ